MSFFTSPFCPGSWPSRGASGCTAYALTGFAAVNPGLAKVQQLQAICSPHKLVLQLYKRQGTCGIPISGLYAAVSDFIAS